MHTAGLIEGTASRVGRQLRNLYRERFCICRRTVVGELLSMQRDPVAALPVLYFSTHGVDSMDAIDRLNSISSDEAEAEFLKCCGSQRWAAAMVGERPFRDVGEMVAAADRICWSLAPDDWLEAFRSHPKIGEKKAAAATSAESLSWSASEQSGTRNSSQQTMDELSRLNREYEQKFGFIYIVCATGRSAEQMLAILRERLSNTRDDEIRNAAVEQAKITALRLRKLVSESGD